MFIDKKILEAKTKEELWSHEKKHFRIWIILSFVLFLLVALLSTTQIILNYLPDIKNIVKDKFAVSEHSGEGTLEAFNETRANLVLMQYTVVSVVMLLITLFSLPFYIISVKNSYKNKTFAYLSKTPVSLYGIAIMAFAIFSFFSISGLNIFYIMFSVVAAIPVAIAFSLVFIGWVFILFNISFIKNIFIKVEAMEKMKKIFNDVMAQQQGNNPFGFNFDPKNQHSNAQNQTEEAQVVEPNAQQRKDPLDPNAEVRAKLKNMSNSKLFEMAKYLNIYGYEDLTTDQLIDKIIENTKK